MSSDKGGQDSGGAPFVLEPHTRVAGTPYQVVGVLGSGGMSTVYEVIHLDTGHHLAFKLLSSHLAKMPVYLKRFLRETQALGLLHGQPHIVRFIDSGVLPNGHPFCTMELLEGATLRQRLRHGPLPLPQAISYTLQVLSALSDVHGNGIVHRDVKPDNVFLQTNGFCKLLDFGVIKVLVEGGPIDGSTVLTAPKTLVGTTHYIPPEQAEFKTPDHRADIYAAGVVLFECLVGRIPFSELSNRDFLGRVIKLGFPSLDDVGAGHFPISIRRVVRVATAHDPNDRYQSAADFITKLLEAAMCEGIEILTPRSEPAAENAQVSSGVIVRKHRQAAKTWTDATPIADTIPLSPRSQAAPKASASLRGRAAEPSKSSAREPAASSQASDNVTPVVQGSKKTPAKPSGERARLSLLALFDRESGPRARPPRAPWIEPHAPSSGEQEMAMTPPPSPIRSDRETRSSSPNEERVTLASNLGPANAAPARDSHPAVESPKVRLVAPFTGRSGRASRRAAVALVGLGLLVIIVLARGRSEISTALSLMSIQESRNGAPRPSAEPTPLPPGLSSEDGQISREGAAADVPPSSVGRDRAAPPEVKLTSERDRPSPPAEASKRHPPSGPEGRHTGSPPRRPEQAPGKDAHDFKPGIESGL
jgi:serine/threonine-protein kinase